MQVAQYIVCYIFLMKVSHQPSPYNILESLALVFQYNLLTWLQVKNGNSNHALIDVGGSQIAQEISSLNSIMRFRNLMC